MKPAELKRFLLELEGALPGMSYSLDAPASEHGYWWVDINFNKAHLTVEFRPGVGFGLYTSETSGFGEGPDMVCMSISLAVLEALNTLSPKP